MRRKKEKTHTMSVRFKPEVYRRLTWLHQQASNGIYGESLDRQNNISMADIINNAVIDYKRDDVVELREKKQRIARELNAELTSIDIQIKNLIEKKEHDKKNELNNAFRAQPIRNTTEPKKEKILEKALGAKA